MIAKERKSSTQEQRRQALETTNEVAREKQEADRRIREEKTRKLRAARLAIQQASESKNDSHGTSRG